MRYNIGILFLLTLVSLNHCVLVPDYSKNFRKYEVKSVKRSISVTKPESRFEFFAKDFYYILAANLIEENLKFSELFSDVKEKDGEYLLTAEKIEDIGSDDNIEVTYYIKVEYSLYLNNKLVFKNTYEGSAISEPSENLMYGFRARLARERALQVTMNKLQDDFVNMKILK